MASPSYETTPHEAPNFSTTPVPVDKIDKLEKLFKSFRAEVDMKFKIMQQILTTRDEQVVVQKELLEREHTLYKNLLGHWRNTSVFAASGLSLNFSSKNVENVDFLQQPDLYDEEYANNFGILDNGPSTSRMKTRRSRKRRKRSEKVGLLHSDDQNLSDSDTDKSVDEHEFMEVEVNPDESSDFDSDPDRIVGKKVYIEYNKGIMNKSGNSVWNSFLREDNGQSALCKLCDRAGIQKILKTVGGSTSGLHNHLKSLHKHELNITLPAPDGEKRKPFSAAKKSPKEGKSKTVPWGTIWTYYEKVQTSDGNASQCKLCEKDGTEKFFKAQKGGSTTGLHRHLLRAHKIDLRSGEHMGEPMGGHEADTKPVVDPDNDITVDSNKSDETEQIIEPPDSKTKQFEHNQRLPIPMSQSQHPQIIPVGTHTEWGPYHQHGWPA